MGYPNPNLHISDWIEVSVKKKMEKNPHQTIERSPQILDFKKAEAFCSTPEFCVCSSVWNKNDSMV